MPQKPFSKLKIALLQTQEITMNLSICGGIERVEIAQLDTLSKFGHHIVLYVSKLIGSRKDIKKIKALDISSNKIKQIYYYYLFKRLYYYFNFVLHTLDMDVLHGHYTPILPLFAPNRSIVHFHGLGIHELIGYSRFKTRYHRGQYVFCSDFIKKDFEKKYPEIPKTHLHVIYNGVDTNIFYPKIKKKEDKIKNIIFYAGWLPKKGIYEVLKMARILERRRKDFIIHYGGTAQSHYKDFYKDNHEEIENKVRKLSEGLNIIRFIGPIMYKDLPDLLRKMDIGLVPSIYPDPFPLVPLEMMASGLPVVAYDIGGLKESIINGITGFLVETEKPEKLAEAVERLLDDDCLRKEMSLAARTHVENNFTWYKHCRKLEIIYHTRSGE